MRPWRIYLWPGIAFGARRPDVAGDDLLHQLGDPHGRPRHLGAGADGDGRAPSSGSRRGSCTSRWWRLATPVGARRLRRRVPRPRAEPVVLRAVGVPAPPDRLDAGRLARCFPLGLVVPAALGRPARPASRSLVVALVGDALLRPRRGAGLRPSLAARRGRRTGETARSSSARACCALAVPAAAWAHATLKHESPGFEQELADVAEDGPAPLRPVRQVPVDRGARRARATTTRARHGSTGSSIVAPVRHAADRRLHGALARALGRRARRLGRLDVRRARRGAAADRGLRRERADADRARRALAVLPLARAR